MSAISPATLAAGSAALTLNLSGTGFSSTNVVVVGNVSEATTYVSTTQLTATVPAAQLTNGALLPVAVANGTVSSSTINLEIDNPAPLITSMSTSTALAGTPSAVITFTGTGFVPSTMITVNGSARATTYINATQVSAALPSSDFSAAGSLSLAAVNPIPGGGTSAAVALAVSNPTVGFLKLSPSVLNVGATSSTTLTVTGSGFVPASVVSLAGTARATTYVNASTLTFMATVADQAKIGTFPVAVSNPAPGGGVSPAVALSIVSPPVTPVITGLSAASIVAGSAATSIEVTGTGFTTNTVVQINGSALPTSYANVYTGTGFATALFAIIPASDLAAIGTASITAYTSNATPGGSNAMTINIVSPPVPTLTSLYPSGGPLNTVSAETLTGTGFTATTTLSLNGQTIPSTVVSSTQITATFPASALAIPGNQSVSVTTPAPGGGTSATLQYTTFVSIANNDLVYNTVDGLLYASVPATAAGAIGNAVVGIDPNTGAITRQIQVGTNPNKLALSSDGTQLFVGIDGAGAVAQVNLAQAKIVNQFSLGGGPGVYNAPYTALSLAAVPGLPNSVAVATTGEYGSGSGVAIFDSGVARTGSSVNVAGGPLSFGSSASKLYLGSSYIDALTLGSTGITNSTQLASTQSTLSNLQYDNGSLYLSNGQVLNAATGGLNGTFYSATNTQANGPVVSDSTLGSAFLAVNFFTGPAAVYVFDESSFTLLGTIPINDLGTQGYPTNFRKIVRWGQNGIAVAAVPSSFTTNNQIYIFHSPLVKDVSAAPADVSVSLTAPATASTGAALSYTVKAANAGPNSAAGATLSATLDPSLILNSVTSSQGFCTAAAPILCDLGGLPSGATATVTINATATSAGTFPAMVSASSSSYDPTPSNNQATASVTVTGSAYGAVPSIASISPTLVKSGSAAFTLTVNGTGFNANSTVNLESAALTTTYVSATQLTAAVTAPAIANYGWAAVTVSNPAPGGGGSSTFPLTIYNLVNVPAAATVYDPYGQTLYATIPSNATALTGNSVVAINPFTASVGTPVAVGSQPTVMAETSDGNYLYIGLSGSDSVAQFNLLTQSVGPVIPIKYQATSSTPAFALAAMPGSDTSLAISFSGAFGIFDINGATGSFRTSLSAGYGGTNPVFASPTRVYAYDTQTTGAEFYRYNVTASGLTLMDGTTLDGLGGFNGGFVTGGGLVYGDAGGIINPTTTPPSQVQTLPLLDFYGSGDVASGAAVVVDPSLQKDF